MKIQGILTQGKWLDFNNMDYSTCAACKDDIKLKNCRCSRGGGRGTPFLAYMHCIAQLFWSPGFGLKKRK